MPAPWARPSSGLPGLTSFFVGSREIPGLTFSRFVFYGARHQDLGVNPLALLLAAAAGVGGAFAARRLFAAGREAVALERTALGRAALALAEPTPVERAAVVVPVALAAAGRTLDTLEVQLLDPIPAAMGESAGALSEALARLRSPRIGVSTAAALAVIALLLAASVLAATGHFPVTFQ